jgi:hypothetical protein
VALAHCLVEQHPAGHRYIHALDAAGLRQPDQRVAGLAGQFAQAIALAAHDQCLRTGQVRLPGQLFALHVGADNPLARIPQQAQRAGQIGDGRQRHGFGRAGGHLAHGRIHAGRAVLRYHHRQGTAGVGGTQAGAEVVRVLHAIEHQHQRIDGGADRFDQLILMPGRQRIHLCQHALVICLAGPGGELLGIHAFGLQPQLLGQ